MSPEYLHFVDCFLQSGNIAVVGYSSHSTNPGHLIYNKLREAGYPVFAVNPKLPKIVDSTCYADLASVPAKIKAVVVCTPPTQGLKVAKDAYAEDVEWVWFHRAMDEGSYDEKAEEYCLARGIHVINFGCPMMFVKPDIAHSCFKWIFSLQGKFDKSVQHETFTHH